MGHSDEGNPYVHDLTPFGRTHRDRHQEKGTTAAVFIPQQADWELQQKFLARLFELAKEVFRDREGWDWAAVSVYGDVLQAACDDHVYLSTSCLHDEHAYCQSNTGLCGQKTPASCKFCGVECICPCHAKTPGHQGLAMREEEDDRDEQSAPESPEGTAQAAAA